MPTDQEHASLLSVRGLSMEFFGINGAVRAVDDVSFAVRAGETLGLVGESGSGKTATALSIARLIPAGLGRITAGRVILDGEELVHLPEPRMRALRGGAIGFIFQDPMTSLNPTLTIGEQIAEPVRIHLGLARQAAHARCVEPLADVGIPQPAQRAYDYPHQLSGGMRQRVMIAIALACSPKLLIADEPTTALDVTIQAQILDLLRRLFEGTRSAIILITHDLGVAARMCDRVAVMYASRIVEAANVHTLFRRPMMPYTTGLLRSIPPHRRIFSEAAAVNRRISPVSARDSGRLPLRAALRLCARFVPRGRTPIDRARGRSSGAVLGNGTRRMDSMSHLTEAILRLEALEVRYPLNAGFRDRNASVTAVDGVSLEIRKGEWLGLVGESGCGKSSLAKAIVRPVEPSGGRIVFEGVDLAHQSLSALRPLRRKIQMIFQDSYSSLNPRMTIEAILEEPLRIRGLARGRYQDRIVELLRLVGLGPEVSKRYPHEFSGGQRQRIGVARALAVEPSFIVCDEPISALDVSIQAQILNLFADLREELGLTYLFIAHNLPAVAMFSDRIAVMYLGQLMEVGTSVDLRTSAAHPYTKALLSAVPVADPDIERRRARVILPAGELPTLVAPIVGCRFRSRCWLYQKLGEPARCRTDEPELADVGADHAARCHFAREAAAT